MTTKITTDNIEDTTLNVISGIKVSTILYPGNDTAADAAGNQTITLLGAGFKATPTVIVNGINASVVTFVSGTQITFTAPANSPGTYTMYVVNPDGATAIVLPGLSYSGVPNWSTAAGSLGNVYETQSINNTFTATGDAPITYSLQSGTLPPGSSLNSANGLLSGTSVATENTTTYTFTIRASDAQNQDTDRQFSLTINPDVVTWSSPANNSTVEAFVNNQISNITMAATSAAGYGITYTANSLPAGLSISGANITGTPTSAANTTTTLTATAATTNRTATRTINWVVTVSNDPYFNYTTLLLNAETVTTSTWIDDASTNRFALTVNGDTRPTAFSPYETVWSNYFDGTGDYLNAGSNAAFSFGTGAYTVELWVYPANLNAQCYVTMDTTGGSAFYFESSQSAGFTIAPRGTGSPALTGGYSSLVINTWNHVVFVRGSTASNQTSIFVNGSRVANGTDSNNWSITGPCILGGLTAGIYMLTGFLSNVRIVKGTAVYDPTLTTLTPPTSPLTAIANTSLLTCQSNRLIDNSTNNFTLTKNGDVTVSNFGPFVETDITTGSGYFDGTGDYLSLTGTANIQFQSGNFTIEGWFYTSSSSAGTFYGDRGAADFTGIVLGIYSSRVTLLMSNGSGWTINTYSIGAGSVITLNAWNHIAIVRSVTTVYVYINGAESYNRSFTGSLSQSSTVRIGAEAGDTTAFNGYISNFRMLKGTALYTSAFTPPTSPLTAIENTSLLTLQNRIGENNNRFVDSSGMNNIITRNGNTTQGTFTPYSLNGYSVYLNGSTSVYTPNQSTFTITSGSNFTIEGWAFPISNTGPALFIFGARRVAYEADWAIEVYVTGTFVRPDTGNRNQASTAVNFPSTMPTGQWSHWALVRSNSGTTITAYLNGVAGTPVTLSGQIRPWLDRGDLAGAIGLWQGVTINNWTADSPTYMTAYTNMVRFVNGRAVYTSNFTPPTTITATTGGQNPPTSSETVYMFSVRNRGPFDASTNAYSVSAGAGTIQVQPFTHYAPSDSYTVTNAGGSMYFDGTGDNLTTPSTTALSFGTLPFTVECWIYNTSSAAANKMILNRWSGSSGDSYQLFLRSNNRICWQVFNQNSADVAALDVPINAWTHIIWTRVGSSGYLYVNGVLRDTATFSNSANGNGVATIGADQSGTAPFTGYISNLRVIKGVALYTSNFVPPVAPLTPIANTTLLLSGTNGGIIDYTGKNNLETVGDARTSAVVTRYGSRSLFFDGTGDWLLFPNSPNLAFGTGNYTVEAWVYFTSLSNSVLQIIFRSGAGGNNFYFHADGDQLSVGTGTVFISNQATTFNTNTWYHVAACRSGTTLRLFKDGVQVGSNATDSTDWVSTGIAGIGSNEVSSQIFSGYIDDLRVTKGYARYTTNFTPPVSALLVK